MSRRADPARTGSRAASARDSGAAREKPGVARRLVPVAVVLVAAIGLGAWWLADDPDDRPLGPIGHVHALAAPTWSDGTLWVGTHHGLLTWTDAQGWRAVGAATHDFMGLAADPERPNVLYGSGNPDLRTDHVNPLGLVVSEDGGRTWEARALAGRSDFHAMVTTPDGAIWGWDAMRAELTRSVDRGASWPEGGVGEAPVDLVFALSPTPDAPDAVFAATTSGLWRTDVDGVWGPAAFAGTPVTAVNLGSDDSVWAYVAATEGGLMRRGDTDAWSSVPLRLDPGVAVIAITTDPNDPDRVFAAATDGSVLYSVDAGASWTPILEHADPR